MSRVGLLLMLSDLLTACHDSAKKQAQSQQLAAQTLQHLSFIQGGSYMMGDFGHSPINISTDNKIAHLVTLDSFSMAQYRITWQQINQRLKLLHLSPNKSYLKLKYFSYFKSYKKLTQNNYPASVYWYEAKDYCLWLGKVSGLPVDLPTEAQWEYAARNRGEKRLFVIDTPIVPGKTSAKGTESVGLYPPSPLGLYDMLGNGYDWTNDWYDDSYYAHSPVHNPQGPTTGRYKVSRGSYDIADYGSLYTDDQTIKRIPQSPTTDGVPTLGFRCVVNQTTPVHFKTITTQ